MKKLAKLSLSLVLVLALILSTTSVVLADGPIDIEFWNCQGGNIGAMVETFVKEFNASQNKYNVVLIYAGGYREALAKLQSTDKANHPDIFMQDLEDAYQVYADPNGLYVPIQDFIDKDEGYDEPSFLGCLRAAYSNLEGRMLAMPLGNSAPGLYYNTKLLADNGLDPEVDLASYAKILETSRKLKAAGVKYPYFHGSSSSFLSMTLAAQGLAYMDNDNGKAGTPSHCLFGDVGTDCYKATVEYFDFLQKMAREDLMFTYGSTTDDVQAAWIKGDVAYWCSWISGYTSRRDAVNGAMEFGFVPMGPISDVPAVGTAASGSCLFVSNSGSEEEQWGAWEFLKFCSSAENNARFAIGTGYMPVTEEAVQQPAYQEFITNDFTTAHYSIDAEKKAPDTCYNAWLPMFNEYHALVNEWHGYAINHLDESPEDITAKFAAAVQDCIDLYRMQYGL